MTTIATHTEEWIGDICRQFSDATGWTLEYTPVSGSEQQVVESTPRDNSDCCWFSEISDGDQPAGFLHLDARHDLETVGSFPAVCDLADVFAQMLNRLSAATKSLEMRTGEVSTLADIGLSIPQDDDLLDSLRQLLRAAVQVTGFRAAGFFLLNPSTNELNLRVVHHMNPEQIPLNRRALTDNPPDLEALTKGKLLLERNGSAESARWLPENASVGLCVAVQSNSGPIGTLWVFDRRHNRLPSDRESHLLESIAAQMANVLERIVLLEECETGHRLQKELKVASECQTLDVLKELPDDAEFDAAGVCTSRFEVGGDMCDLIPIDHHRTIVAVGDASGDSIPAALIMSAVRGSMRSVSVDDVYRTDLVVQRINQVLCKITPPHQFMTLLYGVLDTREGTFMYTNAGHPLPLLVRDGRVSTLQSHGMLLGIVDEAAYDRSVIGLSPGDVLVIFSDGISEASGPSKELFRAEGISAAIAGRTSESAEELLQAIWQRMESHAAGGGRPDDRTLLVIRMPD